MRIADTAINFGAEVIKHQTHIVDDEMIGEAKKILCNSNNNIFKIMENSSLSEEDEYLLMRHIQKRGRIFISVPSEPQIDWQNSKFQFLKLDLANVTTTLNRIYL